MRIKLAIIFASFALASCSEQVPNGDIIDENTPTSTVKLGNIAGNYVYRFCDNGRAVYISSDYDSTAIAIVENAAECK